MIKRGELKTERKPMAPREITYIIEEENWEFSIAFCLQVKYTWIMSHMKTLLEAMEEHTAALQDLNTACDHALDSSERVLEIITSLLPDASNQSQ